jgi:hypothetical protein
MPDELKVHCNSCARQTRHGVLRVYSEPPSDGDALSWQIVQCAGCEGISFYRERASETATPGEWEVAEYDVYPLRSYRPPRDFVAAPDNIERLYRETIDALNSRSFLFCAGGLRALVEGICAERGVLDGPQLDAATGQYARRRNNGEVIRGSTLICKIEGLREKELVTKAQAETLHEQRYLGNRALHELDVPSEHTLSVALSLLEHIMDELYQIPAQSQGLRQSRTSIPAPVAEAELSQNALDEV